MAGALLAAAASGTSRIEEHAMVEAVSDDGQRLPVLNEIYVGSPGHQTGDGIEDDALTLTWGQTVTLRAATRRLQLVR